MYGLDLFAGIGGITIALSEWVRPVAYCEIDRYAQSVLLSRIGNGELPRAPIWDDVTSLNGTMLPTRPEIIYGGFPCQDISVAGNGKGMGGERSGLFYEIVRLSKEIKPEFVFLENVPAIRTRGLDRVVWEFSDLGYDCRWTTLSAQEIGANHKRERWVLLGRRRDAVANALSARDGKKSNSMEREKNKRKQVKALSFSCSSSVVARAMRERPQRQWQISGGTKKKFDNSSKHSWWEIEPDVGRVADGVPARVDRLRGLGNAVVPQVAEWIGRRLVETLQTPEGSDNDA